MAESLRAAPMMLADRLLPGEGLAWDVARIAAANVLLILCAQVAVPLPWTPVPITGQTFGVMFVAVLLGARRAALTLALYLLEGLVGLPVFQPFGLPGAARLAGPTAGYLWAFPAAAYLTGWLVERAERLWTGRLLTSPYEPEGWPKVVERANRLLTLRLIGALGAGQALVLAGGSAWLAVVSDLGWREALASGAAPFLPGELVKIAAVMAAVRGVELVPPRARLRRDKSD